MPEISVIRIVSGSGEELPGNFPRLVAANADESNRRPLLAGDRGDDRVGEINH